ncbi:zinc finger protein Xfin [Myripristis murdjan]|uniref:zinc finger protein Xfin n=1 Tax=Myripristis murdjan TaxID=586833 RepID=UPI00117644A3|nr:zinc finger protein Xfin-like [Myripristis murdjan]XP_029929191.1 zinc finger protein Xfin-like [Myripristis murdjan]XP_029929192.1 zinc finger protein Xfin-like [Myripristis murdjan]
MLGLQGNTSSSKVYRCVACSATFTGLASLLVHQATHASALAKIPVLPPKEPSITPHETAFTNKDLSSQHTSPSALMPESPAGSFYICDCGEEFQDFNLMLEHKHSHVTTSQLLQPLDSNPLHSGGVEPNQVGPAEHESLKPPDGQPVLVLGYPSTSTSSAVDVRSLTDHIVDVSLKESAAQSESSSPQGPCENILATQDQLPGATQDRAPKDKTNSVLSDAPSQGGSLTKNNAIMKLLATAYMKRFQPSPSQKQDKKIIIPKPEDIPVDITPGTKLEVSPHINPSVGQLRRLLTKPGIKTKAPAIARILDSSKKKIVSLTKTLSPVVLLETRQKLIDSSSNGTYGRYQCGRCRKVFQNLDNLTDHHFLHRKERIKCCRHCKQLIIGKLPFPDNHVCPQSEGNTTQQPSTFRKFPFVTKIGSFHSLNNTKKRFFCPLCKHTYARRYNLKMHKCQGPGSAIARNAASCIQKTLILRSNSKASANTEVTDSSQISKSIAVGTEAACHIKVEATSANSGQSRFSELAWSGSAKSFPQFYPKTSVSEQHKDASPSSTSLQQQEDSSWGTAAVCNEESDEGQWTMPLDDEMEMLSSAGDSDDDTETKKPGSVEQGKTGLPSLSFFIRDGVKRYPCNRCQKTYSRPSTLRRHLRLCGFRPHGFGAASSPPQRGSERSLSLNANKIRPMFDCFVCGKSFNRKDNMLAHRKKCQLKRTMTDMEGVALQQSFSGTASSENQTQQDDGGNWGIMSLPSVLPRRVTCECGAGFTSPRLLLEHLQKHAQESYTCPTCGETVSSWADYEVHLQIHMHPHHQLYKGLQPQRSQPLLLRFQQQPSQQQTPPSVHPPPLKQPSTVQLPHLSKKQRIACTRCNNTFSSRCSLRRHISLNRCKGGRVTNPPKTNHCSRCNTDFPNTISLIFHQRSGICKPAIKPVRCPVCVRWFGTVDSLQKHLLTHNQSQSYRCDVCQGTYSTLKSLKNHRRRIHRIMAGGIMPKTKQEQLNS